MAAMSLPAPDEPHLLVVDDDERLRALLQRYLSSNGYRVSAAPGAPEARALMKGMEFDLLILDVMMPGESGLDLTRSVRQDSAVPILMLTARGDPEDRIAGLELGADDYLPKPFEPRELLARVKAILRRGSSVGRNEVLRFGRLEVDPGAYEVRLAGEPRPLTSHQFALLVLLARNAGRVLSRDTIMDMLKSERLEAFDRSIDVHISRIRAAIEDDPKKPRRVITVRGAGYVFAKAQD